MPRTMPLIGQLMDLISHGKPVSNTYLSLWCRAEEKVHINDAMVIKSLDNKKLAFESGFFSNRALGTWQARIAILENLGFIKTSTSNKKFHGKYEYILLINPIIVFDKNHKIFLEKVPDHMKADFSGLFAIYKERLRTTGHVKSSAKVETSNLANEES